MSFPGCPHSNERELARKLLSALRTLNRTVLVRALSGVVDLCSKTRHMYPTLAVLNCTYSQGSALMGTKRECSFYGLASHPEGNTSNT